MRIITIFSVLFFIILSSCQPPAIEVQDQSEFPEWPAGKLFIIGGGKRPAEMVERMVTEAAVRDTGYIVILPMASSEPDTSAYYATQQFTEQGVDNITTFHLPEGNLATQGQLDSIRNASLIYVTGGDQSRFMEAVLNTPVYEALHEAYLAGAMIAGTSAGAAIMSKKMITGNEYKHPEYSGDFKTIEAENIELTEGMGFLTEVIVDQHFIWRMRMNRLISAVIENPGYVGIGIDESTAVLVKEGLGIVVGDYQVIVIGNPNLEVSQQNGLLGARGLSLDVLLPGDTLRLR